MNLRRLVIPIMASLLPFAAAAQEAEIGAGLYVQYCATCHGMDGGGEGPLTEVMLEKPSDLRLLAENNPASPGEFPMLRILHIIDGRSGLRAHGGSMPTYGSIFAADTAETSGLTGSVIETRGRILSLALFLESIQQ